MTPAIRNAAVNGNPNVAVSARGGSTGRGCARNVDGRRR